MASRKIPFMPAQIRKALLDAQAQGGRSAKSVRIPMGLCPSWPSWRRSNRWRRWTRPPARRPNLCAKSKICPRVCASSPRP